MARTASRRPGPRGFRPGSDRCGPLRLRRAPRPLQFRGCSEAKPVSSYPSSPSTLAFRGPHTPGAGRSGRSSSFGVFMVRFHPAARLGLLIGLLVALPRPAAAQFFGKNKVQYEPLEWSVLETPHVRLHYYAEEESLARRLTPFAESTC